MVSICAWVSERLFENCWIPTVLSMCHGGIWRVTTRSLMAFAQGRVSWYVTSDIGAAVPLRWHSSHLACRIGATSLANVTGLVSTFAAMAEAVSVSARMLAPMVWLPPMMNRSFPLPMASVAGSG